MLKFYNYFLKLKIRNYFFNSNYIKEKDDNYRLELIYIIFHNLYIKIFFIELEKEVLHFILQHKIFECRFY